MKRIGSRLQVSSEQVSLRERKQAFMNQSIVNGIKQTSNARYTARVEKPLATVDRIVTCHGLRL